MRFALPWICVALATGSVAAQAATITEDAVRSTVSWLAADERKGRATGSPELDAAAEWLAARFGGAGLRQVREGSWFHEFEMPGVRVDSDAAQLVLTRRIGDEELRVELAPGADVRQWLPCDALTGEEECTVAAADDPVLQRLLRASSARRPIVIEVAHDHPFWLEADGKHTSLSRRRGASRPVLLVRKGALPERDGGGEPSWIAKWQLAAAQDVGVVQRNVVALLPAHEGSDKAGEYVVVSAHYDHVGTGPAVDGDGIYNGADDDATGTTAVVLLAEAFAQAGPQRRNLLFVCFAAEERGLVGSKEFCERPPVPLDGVVANVNIEMIGRPPAGDEQKAWVTGADLSDFAAICGAALEKAGVGLVEFPMAARLFAASDNFSFVRKGIVAHSISAGSLHEDYHQPGDEVDKLDIRHMTSIVQGLYAAVGDLANRDAAPRWNAAGEERLKKLGR